MSEQPKPTPGRQAVTPVARELFAAMLAEREQRGIATYGRSLETHNGRDAVQDALEECADLWQYLVQIKLERDALTAERDALTAERDADRAHLEGLQISYRNASDKAAQLGRALETATRSVDYWREAWEQKHIELEQAESERDALAARLAAAERESAEFSPWIAKMARTCRICDQVGLTGQIDHAPDCPFAALAAALEARE